MFPGASEGLQSHNLFLHPRHFGSNSPQPLAGDELFDGLKGLSSTLATALTSTQSKVQSIDSEGILLHSAFRIPVFLQLFGYRERAGIAAVVLSADPSDPACLSDELDLDLIQIRRPSQFNITSWWILVFSTEKAKAVEVVVQALRTAGAIGSSVLPSSKGWREIGIITQGAFATLFKLKHMSPDDDAEQLLALKVHSATAKDDDGLEPGEVHSEPFVHELKMLVCVQGHPNVCRLRGVMFMMLSRDSESLSKKGGIATHHCLGDLFATCAEKPLTEQVARIMFQGLLCGLEHVHQRQVVHRKLKPKHILITGPGQAILGGFHSSCHLKDLGTAAQVIKPGYTAPEVLHGQGSDERMDVFSLGSCLFFALKGRNAFGTTDAERLQQSGLGFEALSEVDLKGTSRGVQDLLKTLLLPDLHMRPQASVARQHRWVKGLTFGLSSAPPLPSVPARPLPYTRARTSPAWEQPPSALQASPREQPLPEVAQGPPTLESDVSRTKSKSRGRNKETVDVKQKFGPLSPLSPAGRSGSKESKALRPQTLGALPCITPHAHSSPQASVHPLPGSRTFWATLNLSPHSPSTPMV